MIGTADIASLLTRPDFAADPYPAYARLRDSPGWMAPSGYRVFSRYDFPTESVRGHWDVIDAPESFVIPNRTQDFNEMRIRVFQWVVSPTTEG